jgi:hypothetical protein
MMNYNAVRRITGTQNADWNVPFDVVNSELLTVYNTAAGGACNTRKQKRV